MVAELAAVQLDEPVPMAVLFDPHFLEHFCGRGIVPLEALGEIVVDSGVLLFEGDRQGEDLLFAQAFEGSHGSCFRRGLGRGPLLAPNPIIPPELPRFAGGEN